MSADTQAIVEAINALRLTVQVGLIGLSLVVFGMGLLVGSRSRR